MSALLIAEWGKDSHFIKGIVGRLWRQPQKKIPFKKTKEVVQQKFALRVGCVCLSFCPVGGWGWGPSLTCWCTPRWELSRRTCTWSTPGATACPGPAAPARSWCLSRSRHSLEKSSHSPLLPICSAKSKHEARLWTPVCARLHPTNSYLGTMSFHSFPCILSFLVSHSLGASGTPVDPGDGWPSSVHRLGGDWHTPPSSSWPTEHFIMLSWLWSLGSSPRLLWIEGTCE